MKKKLTALVLSLVLAAIPATPVMNVQTVSAATTTTKAAVQKNTWSKDHKYYYDNKGKTKGPHAWVEIKIKNKTYVYDPNFQKEFGPKGYTGYAIRYGQKGTLKYIKKKVY